MKNKGFTLIELLVVILIIGILLALIIPNFVLFQERARRASVKNNMHVVQTSLEAYAVDHMGNYPNEDVSWEYGDDDGGIVCWFPGGDPIGTDGEMIPGNFPVNPYTGRRYNSDDEDESLMYVINDLIDEPGMAAQTRTDDDNCPWEEYECESEVQGSVAIQAYATDEQEELGAQEYGIAGWGRDLTNIMFDRDPIETDVFIYFVLHN
jgi:prepilin-type N-terminal cleavage/methylation domain-containing protein